MTFANPNALWLLLVFPPALVVFFWWSWRQRQALMARFIQTRLLAGLLSGVSPARDKVRAGALVLAVVCLIIALARPQWGFTWEEVKQRGLDIVVGIDTSKSMLAEDIPPNRLARAKLAALELLQRAKSDRLGLVAFAGSAFLQCPLTIDDAVFRQSVDALDVHSISQGGTAIAEAIDTAMGAFKEGDNHKVLVLFTDGEDHDSGALEAAKKAAAAGLQIFTIGIGSVQGELLRIKDANGHADYIRDEQGNVVKSHLNEELLQRLAGLSERGFYLPLRGATTIDTLYEKGLAPLPKGEGNEKLSRRMQERYHWPLGLGLLLLVLEVLLPERKREPMTRPAGAVTTAAKPSLARAVVVLILLALPLAGFASPSSALRQYKAGQYDQALKEYEQLLQRKGDDPRLHFNAGASAYRNRRYEEAAKQFEAAVRSPDLNLQSRAYYNRGNALYCLGESYPDPSKKAAVWEQSLKAFNSTMKLNPQDADARFNHDFVTRQLEELRKQQQQSPSDQNLQPSEAAKKAKAQADEAVRRREYPRALEIMEKQLETDQSVNYYGQFMKKLKEVVGVQESAQH